MENSKDEDIKILKEFTESSCCLYSQEEIIEAIKNVLLELGNLKWKNEIYVKSIKSHKSTIEKQDKMIDLMARMLVEVPTSVSDDSMTTVVKASINRDLEVHKKVVINYVRNKVESEGN
jgi:methionine synthase II (cobalamin-independent)